MAEVLLFHHALGVTPGVLALAARLQEAGHTVHVPDLYDGTVLDDVESGVAHARQIGFGEVLERGRRAAETLPADLFYLGISLGVMPAQALAQTRAGALGAVLLEACVPPAELGSEWPAGVPVQVHGMDADPSFAGEGDLDAARELVASVPDGELFTYPGDGHLFTDASLSSHDAAATDLVMERVLRMLKSGHSS